MVMIVLNVNAQHKYSTQIDSIGVPVPQNSIVVVTSDTLLLYSDNTKMFGYFNLSNYNSKKVIFKDLGNSTNSYTYISTGFSSVNDPNYIQNNSYAFGGGNYKLPFTITNSSPHSTSVEIVFLYVTTSGNSYTRTAVIPVKILPASITQTLAVTGYSFSLDTVVTIDTVDCIVYNTKNIHKNYTTYTTTTNVILSKNGYTNTVYSVETPTTLTLSELYNHTNNGLNVSNPLVTNYNGIVNVTSISVPNNTVFTVKTQIDDLCVGVKENNKVKFNVYPNPTSGYINITSETGVGKVTMYDMFGKVVMSVVNTNTIYVGDLPNGIYTIQIGNTTKKIVKE